MRSRHAQAAIEFLTTYGWAFLVILVMVAALSYFGVLDPSRFVPNSCQFTAGISCTEMGVSTLNKFILVLRNNMGTDLVIGAPRVLAASGTSDPNCFNASLFVTSFTGADTNDIIAPAWGGVAVQGQIWNATQNMYIRLSRPGCVINATDHMKIQFAFDVTPVGKSYTRTIQGDIYYKS